MIRVLIAEDFLPILKKCKNNLNKDPQIEVVAAVTSGREAVQKAIELKPDVALLDIEMETLHAGLDATKKILTQLPNTKIIIFTVYEDDETVFRAFQLGVSDYVLKNANESELTQCVKDAYLGRSPIRPVIASKIRREFQRVKSHEKSMLYCLQIVSQLTQSEIDILDLCDQGYSRAEICDIRHVEMSTIKTQIRSLLKKFQMNNVDEVLEVLRSLDILNMLRHIDQIPGLGEDWKI